MYPHTISKGHALLAGVSAPLADAALALERAATRRAACSRLHAAQLVRGDGADGFVREERSLLLFFQGHPEYEETTLLKEYRRDVGRYLNAQQPHYPTLPRGYLSADATLRLMQFRSRRSRAAMRRALERFPFAAIAAGLQNSWRASAVAMYRNWLAFISARRVQSPPIERVATPRSR